MPRKNSFVHLTPFLFILDPCSRSSPQCTECWAQAGLAVNANAVAKCPQHFDHFYKPAPTPWHPPQQPGSWITPRVTGGNHKHELYSHWIIMQSNELIMGTIPFSREGYDVLEKFIYYHCWQASLSMHCVTNTNPYLNIIIEVILKCITTTTQLAKISFSNGELAEIFFFA